MAARYQNTKDNQAIRSFFSVWILFNCKFFSAFTSNDCALWIRTFCFYYLLCVCEFLCVSFSVLLSETLFFMRLYTHTSTYILYICEISIHSVSLSAFNLHCFYLFTLWYLYTEYIYIYVSNVYRFGWIHLLSASFSIFDFISFYLRTETVIFNLAIWWFSVLLISKMIWFNINRATRK